MLTYYHVDVSLLALKYLLIESQKNIEKYITEENDKINWRSNSGGKNTKNRYSVPIPYK